MREIKFRVWNTEKKYMDYGKHNNICLPINTGIVSEWDDGQGWDSSYSKDYIPMQFTGLKDKNGKEIYEGDILSVNDYPDKMGMYGEYGIVIFEKGSFIVELIETKRKFQIDETSEVIGNKFENPELLR